MLLGVSGNLSVPLTRVVTDMIPSFKHLLWVYNLSASGCQNGYHASFKQQLLSLRYYIDG